MVVERAATAVVSEAVAVEKDELAARADEIAVESVLLLATEVERAPLSEAAVEVFALIEALVATAMAASESVVDSCAMRAAVAVE